MNNCCYGLIMRGNHRRSTMSEIESVVEFYPSPNRTARILKGIRYRSLHVKGKKQGYADRMVKN